MKRRMDLFLFSSRRRHTCCLSDWSSDVCSSDLVVYDVSWPLAPRRLGRFELGGEGVHRIVWTGGRYAHMSATPPGFADRIWLVLDLADPARPRSEERRGGQAGGSSRWSFRPSGK